MVSSNENILFSVYVSFSSWHDGLGAIVVHGQHLRVVPQDRAGARQEDRRHQVGCHPQEDQGVQQIMACVTVFMCDELIREYDNHNRER